MVKTDVIEPSGVGRAFGVNAASAQCKIVVNLTRANTDFIRGAFYWWGDAPLQIALETQDNSNQIFFQPNKYFGMNHGGWRLEALQNICPYKRLDQGIPFGNHDIIWEVRIHRWFNF